VLERPDAAIVFPVTGDGEVVLVRQYRPPLERMELGLPAGLIEEGEVPQAAARRELAEETGYGGGGWEPLGALASSPSLKNNWAYLFLARGVVSGLVRSGEIVSSSGVAAVMLALDRLDERS
jgi:ADP-ribose pyrophosphatase